MFFFFSSRSGPNQFAKKLAVALSNRGHVLAGPHENPEVQLSFIQATGMYAPLVQRLDGIWFNVDQDWENQNAPIERTYCLSRAVVFQTEFNKRLCERFFGEHPDPHVISNGTNVDLIDAVDPLSAPSLRDVEKVWTCAASWRPHKRLAENVRYFQEHAGEKDCLIIAGANPDVRMADPRIFYAGDLEYQVLISLYRATDYFIHLSYLDHCPNVVVDARAAGAHIICSSLGGTKEIAGSDATVIEEDEWDFEPCKLYEPPAMDFSRKTQGGVDSELDINIVAEQYESVLMGAL